MRTIFAGAFACFLVGAAMAESTPNPMNMSGNQFEALYDDDAETRTLILAMFAKRIGEQSRASSPNFVCWPTGATYLQAAKVIEAFLQQHPQFLNYSMHDLAAAALIEAFPCTPH